MSRDPIDLRRRCRRRQRLTRAALESLERRVFLSASLSSDVQPAFVLPAQGGTLSPPFTPSQVDTAYGVNQISFNGVTGNGAGQTIAVVDAYNDPDIITDANTFSSENGLAQFNVAGGPTLTVLNQNGSTSPLPANASKGTWDIEESLDVEWAHAVAPMANIMLFEANSDGGGDIFTTVQTAADAPGVSVVSMSFYSYEQNGEQTLDNTFTTPAGHVGETFFAASGDLGFPGGYPAASPNVVSVGGTSLTINSDGSYGGETGWSGSGGNISDYEPQPTDQNDATPTFSLTQRTAPDVSWLANPNTGVEVVDSYDGGTFEIGGTSLATPMWAALCSIIDQGRALDGQPSLDGASQTLPLLYALPSSDFHDVTSGDNGYSAGAGYDLVTGRGSPVVPSLVNDMVAASVVYVDAGAPGTVQNGTSWPDAYTTLPPALSTTPTGLEVIDVAAGTYYPSSSGNRSATFQLADNVVLEGGFAGYGATNPDSSGSSNVTILSGAIGSGGSYHVVTASGTNSTAVLEGFTITSGDADGTGDATSGYGGGVYISGGSPSIVDCMFTDNASLGGGAAIYDTNSSPTLLRDTFTANSTSGYGGGVANDNGSSPALTDCMFNGNLATQDGGGMSDGANSNPTLLNCTFVGNGSSEGGGIFNGTSSPLLENCTLTDNSASLAGGAIYSNASSTATLDNSILWADIAPANAELGGAGLPNVNYCDVDGGGNGTAVMNANPLFLATPDPSQNNYGNLELEPYSPCVHAGNDATVPTSLQTDLAGFNRIVNQVDLGAYECQVIYVDSAATGGSNNGSSWTNAYTSLTTALSAALWGEQIDIAGGIYVPGVNTVNTFTLKDGVTLDGGFAGLASSNSYTVNYTSYATVLSGNLGGGEQAYHVVTAEFTDTTAVLDGIIITDGNASGAATSQQQGGGLFGGSPTVINCIFTGNSASSEGGAMYIDSNLPDITNCTFTNNTAPNGGAVYDADVSPTFVDCTFTSNSASGSGGGIYSSASTIALTGCTFTSNSATQSGGGIYFDTTSSTLTACIFDGNTSGSGGGVYNESLLAMSATNCVFDGNSATQSGGGGGAMYDAATQPNLTNCTFTANAAGPGKGGAIYNFASTVTATNCIFWKDTATSGIEFSNQFSSGMVVSYSDGTNRITGTGNISTDPLFVASPNISAGNFGNLQLQETSPCINAGSNAAIAGFATDVAGNPRIVDGTVDMGAYEAQRVAQTWTGGGDGINWSNAANWSRDYVPTANDDLTIPSGVASLQIASGSFPAGSISSQSPITVTSTGTLALYGPATFSGGALIVNNGGTLQIDAGGSVSGNVVDNGNVTINRSDAALSLAANISGIGALIISGPGTITLIGSNTFTGGTTISAGTLVIGAVSSLPSGGSVVNDSNLVIDAGTSGSPVVTGAISGSGAMNVTGYLQLSGSGVLSQQSGLSISSGSTFDIGADTFLINYGSMADPIASVVTNLTSGRNGGSWNGAGIMSSAVAAANSSGGAVYGVGYADGADGVVTGLSSGQIVLAPALLGDAKLTGTVVFGDFQILGQNFGDSGGWDAGNWTYGSTIGFGDFQELAINFGKTSQFAINLGSGQTGGSVRAESSPAVLTRQISSTTVSPAKISSNHPAASPSLFADQPISAPSLVDELLGGIVQMQISLDM